MAKQKYEPCPKGYKRVWLIVGDNTGKVEAMYHDRLVAEDCVWSECNERVVPIDIPLSALKPAKVRK